MAEPDVKAFSFEVTDLRDPPTLILQGRDWDTVVGYRVYGPAQSVTLRVGGQDVVTHPVKNGKFIVPLDIDVPLWRLRYHEVQLRACLQHDAVAGQTVMFEVLHGKLAEAHKRNLLQSSVTVAHAVDGHSDVDNIYIHRGMAWAEPEGQLLGPGIGVRPVALQTKLGQL